MPTTLARRKYSATVDRLTPTDTATSRSLRPSACFSLKASRIFRIGALSAGIGPPLLQCKGGRVPRFVRRQRERQAHPKRVAGYDRNRWPTSVGTGGRIASESVAGLARITQSPPPPLCLFFSSTTSASHTMAHPRHAGGVVRLGTQGIRAEARARSGPVYEAVAFRGFNSPRRPRVALAGRLSAAARSSTASRVRDTAYDR